MIKYKLICKDCEVAFDSWFSTSKEYEKLKKKKFLNCHICNSLNVEKTLMSPNVLKSKNNVKVDVSSHKYKEIKKQYLNIKNSLKKILSMLGRILLMKQDLYITKINKFLKEFMELQQRKILKS